MREPPIGRYRDADGNRHELLVRETAEGGWQVLDADVDADTAHVVDELADEPTRVFTRAELMRAVWGRQTFGHTRTLDSHAFRLRRKLCGDSADKLVINVWGVGYRLVPGGLHRMQATASVR